MKKSAEQHIKDQLNADRLTPLQWDGILRAMHQYKDQEVAETNSKILQYIDVCMVEDHTDSFYFGVLSVKNYIKYSILRQP